MQKWEYDFIPSYANKKQLLIYWIWVCCYFEITNILESILYHCVINIQHPIIFIMQHWYDKNANYKSNSLPRNILWKNCCGDILRETLSVCNIISLRLCCSPCIFPLRSIRFIIFSIMKFKCNSRGWNLQYIKCKILFLYKVYAQKLFQTEIIISFTC